MGTSESIDSSLPALSVLNIKCLCKWVLGSNSPSGLDSIDAIYSHENELFLHIQKIAWNVYFEAMVRECWVCEWIS